MTEVVKPDVPMKHFAIVVAADRRGGIGKTGQSSPWPTLKEDMTFIYRVTTHLTPSVDGKEESKSPNRMNALIMGRITYQSLPETARPLRNRISYVITSRPEEVKIATGDRDRLFTVSSFTDALIAASINPQVDQVFVFGGGRVYAGAVSSPFCHFIYYTQVLRVFDCDVFFPAIDTMYELVETCVSDIKTDKTVPFQFLGYKPRRGKSLVDPYWPLEEKKETIVVSPPVELKHVANPEEQQYLDLIRRILDHGNRKSDRTGIGTLSTFGAVCRYSLRGDRFPLLTTKKVNWRGIAEELLWILQGKTSARDLQAKKVRVWDKNGSREVLDHLGLRDREEFDLGPIYGFAWRYWGATYVDAKTEYKGQGVDQLMETIDLIKTSPDSRRIVMTAWNPADLKKMALPPCHCLVQFYVYKGELSCIMYQRSCDMGLGVPWNISSYCLLTKLMAEVCGLKPGEFCHMMADTHCYLNHIEPLREQLTRTPRPFPTLRFRRPITSITEWTVEDLVLSDYHPYPHIPMDMAV